MSPAPEAGSAEEKNNRDEAEACGSSAAIVDGPCPHALLRRQRPHHRATSGDRPCPHCAALLYSIDKVFVVFVSSRPLQNAAAPGG